MQITIQKSNINHYQLVRYGLEKRGITVYEGSNPQTDKVACWGWRRGKELRDKGHDVLVFERGYLGDRHYYTSIGWNGLNGHADFKVAGDEKIKGDWPIKDWHDGEYIVIMGQVMGDASLKGQNLTAQYEQWAADAEKHYNMPVFFRPHPNTSRGNFNPKIPKIEGDLNDVLQSCHLVLCYNSNSSVDAVINGVPCVTFDRGSMAYEVTGNRICDRIKPDREKWLARLSNCQWTPEEIRNGDYVERFFCK
jgi:hypothetical protein